MRYARQQPRRPTTRDRLELFLMEWEQFKEQDKAWKHKHENNHHGKWSQVKEHTPWSLLPIVIMFGAGFVMRLLGV